MGAVFGRYYLSHLQVILAPLFFSFLEEVRRLHSHLSLSEFYSAHVK